MSCSSYSALFPSTTSLHKSSVLIIILINCDLCITHSPSAYSVLLLSFSFTNCLWIGSFTYVPVVLVLFMWILFRQPVCNFTVDVSFNLSLILSPPFNVWLLYVKVWFSYLSSYIPAIILLTVRFLLINISCLPSKPSMYSLYISFSSFCFSISFLPWSC